MPKSEMGHNFIKYLFAKSRPGHLHCRHSLCAKYHDPSSNGSPDILLIRFHRVQCINQKRKIIQSNIYRVLPKVNQVIYTLDTFCMPNTMTLAQAVLQIFCSQGPPCVKCLSLKREIIQSNFDRIL